MNTAPYHVTVYYGPTCSQDSGYYHAEYNVRMTGDELIAFNRRVAEIRETIEADHKKRQQAHWDRMRQLEKQGKSTRHEGIGPMRPEFSVHIVLLEETVIDGTKLMEEFDTFVISEGLWETA